MLLEFQNNQEFSSSISLLPVAGTLSCWISEIFLGLNLWDFKFEKSMLWPLLWNLISYLNPPQHTVTSQRLTK